MPPSASAIVSPIINTLLVELAILPPCPILIFDGPEVVPAVTRVATWTAFELPLSVMSPELAYTLSMPL